MKIEYVMSARATKNLSLIETEATFGSVKELKAQLKKDVENPKQRIETLYLIFNNGASLFYQDNKISIFAAPSGSWVRLMDVKATPRHLLHYIREERTFPQVRDF